MQDIPLDEAHFPDATFRQCVSRALDTNKDGVLTREEREDIYYMDLDDVREGKYSYWYEADMNDGRGHYFAPGVEEKFTLPDDYMVKNTDKITLNVYRGGYPSESKIINIKGVEYLFNLEEVRIPKYETICGSFINNANLKRVWVQCYRKGKTSYDRVVSEFPLSQLTYLHLENVNITVDKIDAKKMPDLEVLRIISLDGTNPKLKSLDLSQNTKLKELQIILPDGTNQKMKSLDLSQNKNLEDLELANIVPPTLNLKGNTKLKSVKVYTGKAIWKKKKTYEYYQPKKNMSCKIQFPKKNNISTLYYLVDNTSLDIRNLTNLENIQTLKKVKMKAKSSWIRKTFNKNNWGCIVSKDGVYQKKIKASKKKTTII